MNCVAVMLAATFGDHLTSCSDCIGNLQCVPPENQLAIIGMIVIDMVALEFPRGS